MFKIKRKENRKVTSGSIAYLVSDLARYDEFYESLRHTVTPDGTITYKAMGVDIVSKLNEAIKVMKGDWIWFLGDDHVWHHELLMKLLDRDVDVVVPLCSRRKPPFSPTIFKNDKRSDGQWGVMNWNEIPQTSGLLKVEGRIGTAGMLIRKKVLDKIGFPWFEIGQECSHLLQEDMYFCKKIQEAGFDIYCDLDHPIGHIFRGVVWPISNGVTWGNMLELGPNAKITVMQDKTNEVK